MFHKSLKVKLGLINIFLVHQQDSKKHERSAAIHSNMLLMYSVAPSPLLDLFACLTIVKETNQHVGWLVRVVYVLSICLVGV